MKQASGIPCPNDVEPLSTTDFNGTTDPDSVPIDVKAELDLPCYHLYTDILPLSILHEEHQAIATLSLIKEKWNTIKPGKKLGDI